MKLKSWFIHLSVSEWVAMLISAPLKPLKLSLPIYIILLVTGKL